MPKPGFFRRLLGKKDKEESDDYDEELHHVRRRAGSSRVNQTFIIPERDENYSRPSNPYHTNKIIAYRKGTRSCVSGRGLDDPTSDSDDDVASVHTEVKSYRPASRRHSKSRRPIDIDDRISRPFLRDVHNSSHRAQRREFVDDDAAWYKNRIAQLEDKVEGTCNQLYKMTNKWVHQTNRYDELNDKYHRLKEKYCVLKQKYEDLQNNMMHQTQVQQPLFMNAPPPLQGTPSSFPNYSLLNHRSASLLTSPVRSSMPPQIPSLSKFEEVDEVKNFRGASAGARETLMSEASTSRVSNPSPQPEIGRGESLMSIERDVDLSGLIPTKDEGYLTGENQGSVRAICINEALKSQFTVPRKIRRASSR